MCSALVVLGCVCVCVVALVATALAALRLVAFVVGDVVEHVLPLLFCFCFQCYLVCV